MDIANEQFQRDERENYSWDNVYFKKFSVNLFDDFCFCENKEWFCLKNKIRLQ
jgi:hypothetical protein